MSNDQKFEMHLIVPIKLVGPIVELMAGEGVVVTMSQHVEKVHSRKKTRHSYANGMKDKGMLGNDAVLEIMTNEARPLATLEVGKLMATKHGFAESSASSYLSKLLREGKVTRDPSNGKYALKG